jgi:phytoene dehydrogenase-like protein
VADIREHGGEVRTNVELKTILFQGERACGVELATGERMATSGFVASGLNPQQTFLRLVAADRAGSDLCQSASQFQYHLLAPLFALNLALSEPPRYTAAEHDPALASAFMVILGLERFTQFHDIVSAHQRGQIPQSVMWGACPTLFDPSQAPAGGHTAFMWEKLPYAIHGDPAHWDGLRQQHAEKMLSLWATYAPNLKGAVLDAFARSPLDTERSLPNMQNGDLLVGSFAGGQISANRPFAGAGQYRTPLAGLYLCGGSTHPGGNITGLCGYNAARVIAADLGCQVWWNPPDADEALRSLP